MRELNLISSIVVKWIVTLAAVSCVVLLAIIAYQSRALERAAEGPDAAKPPSLIDSAGAIRLSVKQVKANRIEVGDADGVTWIPKVAVYGRVVPNPRATFEIRAPFAGRLVKNIGAEWPKPASHVTGGTLFGQIEVRVSSQDRLDVLAKLMEAKLKMDGAERVRKIHQEKVDRFQSAPASFARGDLDAALVALAEAETVQATSRGAVELWQGALTAIDEKQTTWNAPLWIPADGEIAELVALPQTQIEAGTLIAKVVDYRKPLVKIDVPLNLQTAAPETLALQLLPPLRPALEGPTDQLQALARTDKFNGKLLGVAPQLDAALQAVGYLYDVYGAKGDAAVNGKLLRPGLFVEAELDQPGKTEEDVIKLPLTVLLRFQGRYVVYRVKKDPPPKFQIFVREEVLLKGVEGNFAFVTGNIPENLQPGDRIVTRGSMTLLSLEFRTDSDD